jgi:hypothetical protein
MKESPYYAMDETTSQLIKRKSKSSFMSKMAVKYAETVNKKGKKVGGGEEDEDLEMIKSLKNAPKSEVKRGMNPDEKYLCHVRA